MDKTETGRISSLVCWLSTEVRSHGPYYTLPLTLEEICHLVMLVTGSTEVEACHEKTSGYTIVVRFPEMRHHHEVIEVGNLLSRAGLNVSNVNLMHKHEPPISADELRANIELRFAKEHERLIATLNAASQEQWRAKNQT